jgi:hypothetical protein
MEASGLKEHLGNDSVADRDCPRNAVTVKGDGVCLSAQ